MAIKNTEFLLPKTFYKLQLLKLFWDISMHRNFFFKFIYL